MRSDIAAHAIARAREAQRPGLTTPQHSTTEDEMRTSPSPRPSNFPRASPCQDREQRRKRKDPMIILGLILLLLGIVLGVGILYTVGAILLVVGVILYILGATN